MTHQVAAIIVTYNTDLGRLGEILGRLAEQAAVIVVDNSTQPGLGQAIAAEVAKRGGEYLSMGGNEGIGRAQNRGIERAWSRDLQSVLLLDDDSLPAADLVEQLATSLRTLTGDCVVAASALDERGREINHVLWTRARLARCRELRSSGTLISRGVFQKVGAFDEGLFVDGVDFDWGWRAQQLGVRLYICRDTSMVHRLGVGSVLGFRFPTPVRHYFQYRNVIRLMSRSYVPLGWKASQLLKLPVKLCAIAILLRDRRRRLGFAVEGIRDGVRGIEGPVPTFRHLNAQD